MVIKYRIGWDKGKVKFLKNYNVKLKEEHSFFLVEFDDKLEGYQEIVEFANKHNFCVTKEAKFNKHEMDIAEWFAIDCAWTNLYPYPLDEFEYLKQTYDLTNYCKGNEPNYYCRLGKIQNHSFCVTKTPKWYSKNIMRLNLIMDELFVSSHCKEKLQESDLEGFTFEPVFIKNKIATDMFQLKIKGKLPKCLKAENFEEIFTCPICKRSKYLLKSGFIKVEKSAFEKADFDIIKTSEKIGQIGADSLIIISKKMYQFLKTENLSSGMKFIPLILE
jgi:hypothetical protein